MFGFKIWGLQNLTIQQLFSQLGETKKSEDNIKNKTLTIFMNFLKMTVHYAL